MTGDSSAAQNSFVGSDRVFEVCLVLLVTNGFVAILAAGGVDWATASFVIAALGARTLHALGRIRLNVDRRWASAAAILFLAAFPLDYIYLSGDFVTATLRLMFLFTALKLAIANRPREYFYLGVLAFLQLLTVSMFIGGLAFLGVLLIFLVLAATAYAAYEVKRGCESGAKVAASAATKRTLGRRLFALGALLATGILAVSLGLFAVLPRPQGLAGGSPLRGDYGVGFSPEVNLSLIGSLTADPTPVMRVQSLDGESLAGLRWRGLALYRFDGVRWSAERTRASTITGFGGGYAMRPGHGRRVDEGRTFDYRVSMEPLPTDVLFLAGKPEQIRGSFPLLLLADTDAIYAPEAALYGLTYEASGWLPDRSKLGPSDVVELFSNRFQEMYLKVPSYDPRISRLATEVIGDERAPLRQAERLEEFFRSEFDYTLDLPTARVQDPLAHFLFERRKGHCEYFASAMALMLRVQGIPSRLVNGFAGGVRNPITGLQVLRSSDAHSWVEAYIAGYGWLEFDPTPANPDSMGSPWLTTVWMYWDALQSTWAEWVVGYDTSKQVELARAVQQGSRSTVMEAALRWEKLRNFFLAIGSGWDLTAPAAGVQLWRALLPAAALLVVGLGLYWWLPRAVRAYHRWRLAAGRGGARDCSFFYRRALRTLSKRGVKRSEWQTAEELEAAIADPRLRDGLQRVVAAYNAARFGGDPAAERQLPALVEALERL